MASRQDRQSIVILLAHYSPTIHTIRILYVGIWSTYKTMPSPAIRLQNGVDPDQYIYTDPSLPIIYLLYIIRLSIHTDGISHARGENLQLKWKQDNL